MGIVREGVSGSQKVMGIGETSLRAGWPGMEATLTHLMSWGWGTDYGSKRSSPLFKDFQIPAFENTL